MEKFNRLNSNIALLLKVFALRLFPVKSFAQDGFQQKFTKRCTLFAIMLLSLISAYAHDFEENGIYYDKVGDGSCVEVVIGRTSTRGGGWEHHFLEGDVVIPARTSRGYKVIGIAAGAYCRVSSISLPETLLYIESGAFLYAPLTELYIPKSVTNIEPGAFTSCSRLEKIEVDKGNTVYDSRENSNAIIRTADNALVVGCVNTIIPNSIRSIDYKAFIGNSAIKKMVIPNTIMNIGANAFEDCLNLESIVLPENLTILSDHLFDCCKSLKSIEIPNNVTSIGYATFYKCDSLSCVKFSSNLREIGEYGFASCGKLKELNFISNVTINEGAFEYCGELEKVCFENNIIGGETQIEAYAFQACGGLKELILPKNLTRIAQRAFEGCVGLEKIIVEEGNSIYESAEDNNSIMCRTIENGIPIVDLVLANKDAIISPKVHRLAPYAFLYGRRSVIIPENVLSIQKYSFYGCRSLDDVYMKSSTPPNMTQPASDDGAFYWNDPRVMTLYVPVGAKEIYSDPTLDWCLFGSIVEWYPSDIEDVCSDEKNIPVEYYNLQGVKVENPDNGVYIKKQGSRSTKVVL